MSKGPVIGSALYEKGGFGLPFWTVGAASFVLAVCLFFLIPKVKSRSKDAVDDSGKVLTVKNVFTVRKWLYK